jgi:hypothetical protein
MPKSVSAPPKAALAVFRLAALFTFLDPWRWGRGRPTDRRGIRDPLRHLPQFVDQGFGRVWSNIRWKVNFSWWMCCTWPAPPTRIQCPRPTERTRT